MLGRLSVLFSLTFLAVGAEVKLKGTNVIGKETIASKVEFFGGIPFAEVPTGNLRFRPPVLKAKLEGRTFNATHFGPSCLQQPAMGIPADQQSEDCLTLNIYRPTGVKPGAKLPILMWNFGGGFVHGGAAETDGSLQVARSVERGTPMIHVSFNHRLGPFGYPIGPEAFREKSLNLALQDVLTALEWLHKNIGEFGGDPKKITMFGASSGSMTITDLYFAKGIEKMIRGAIFQSGAAGTVPLWNATERNELWQGFVSNFPSCASLASSEKTFSCLRKAPLDEIKNNYVEPADASFMNAWWGPTIDPVGGGKWGSLLPDFPSRLFEQGKFARIPFMAGNDLDEGTGHGAHARDPSFDEAALKQSLIAQYLSTTNDPAGLDKFAEGVMKLYPDIPAEGSPFRTGNELFGLTSIYKRTSAIEGDIMFFAPVRQWMHAAVAKGVKSYGYLFSHPKAGTYMGDPAYGVHHGAEQPYIFGYTNDTSSDGQELKTRMMDYWISFAVNLDPNDGKGSSRPQWPRYAEKSGYQLLQLEGANTTAINDDFRAAGIDFINANALLLRR